MRAVDSRASLVVLLATLMTLSGLTSSAAAQQGAPAAVTADTGQTVTVSGSVYDSVARAPLANAVVQLIDATKRQRLYSAVSDSAGRFQIPQVRTGQYIAGFFHPNLDALGLEAPLKVVTITAAPVVSLDLAIPGTSRVLTAVCGSRPAGDSTGAMAGVVRSADSGTPVPGAKVIVTWIETVIDKQGLHSERKRVPAQVREDGSYLICGLPGDDDVAGSAEAVGRQSGLIDVHIPASSVARRDFAIGDSTAAVTTADSNTVLRGSARLSGTVRGPDKRPINGAKVLVWGTGLTANTDAEGKFALADLPAGTVNVEARALGFVPAHTAVDLASNKTASVALSVDERATTLQPVSVFGKRSAGRQGLNEFLRRRQGGSGYYITAEDIERYATISITDALRSTPGLRVSPGRSGYQLSVRGGCSPEVYLDGVHMADGAQNIDQFVRPEQVAGIEVYTGVAGAPVQYESNGCGAVLVWTRR
ncbi:MAG: carboxypeptidase regulatory-like domain-containing protein [Gemmatimonadaceae bacterium]